MSLASTAGGFVNKVAKSGPGEFIQQRMFGLAIRILNRIRNLQGDAWRNFLKEYAKRAVPEEGTNLSRALTTQADNKFIVETVAAEASKSPKHWGIFAASLLAVVGGTTLTMWLNEDVEDKGSEDATTASAALSIVKKVLDIQMDAQGDGVPGTIWNQDADTYKLCVELQKTADRMIGTLVQVFGSLERAKQVFVAFQTLELEQFDLYKVK